MKFIACPFDPNRTSVRARGTIACSNATYSSDNKKRSKGLNLKKGDKVQLLYKNFKSKQLNKKLDYIKLGPFKIIAKILKIIYQLDLLAKIKIYLVQYIIILKPVQGNIKPLAYKIDIYRS